MTPEWFLEERGIKQSTLDAFGIRFVGDEVVIPYPTGEKYRYYDENGKRQFRFTKGMKPSLFGPRPPEDAAVLFLCEGETDTMRLWQELLDENGVKVEAGVLGIGGVDTWRKLPEYEKNGLMSFANIFLILDNDPDYNVKNHVDKAAMDIRREFGVHRVKRIHLPDDVKDICEFFEAGYSLDSLRLLARKHSSVSRFKPLDLAADPPPVKWLLDGLIALGDVTLFSGPSGVGKSWITMGLSQAVADGWETFLNRALLQHGRVLVVDEENPEDVVYERMISKLGLKNKHNLRYIWNNGVRLDKNPDLLLEEILDWQPVFVVLDSLTRIHSQEENSAGDMAPLLNDCIRPLARETGAAVVLIHHHDKAGTGPRGSGDILASVDGAIDAYGIPGTGSMRLKLTKSRRRLGDREIEVRIHDEQDRTTLRTNDIVIHF